MDLLEAKEILNQNGYRINKYVNEELSTDSQKLKGCIEEIEEKLSKVRSDWDSVCSLINKNSENNNKAIEHYDDVENVLSLLWDVEYQIQGVKSRILR